MEKTCTFPNCQFHSDNGDLDSNHVYCAYCQHGAAIIHFNARSPLNQMGKCADCGAYVRETFRSGTVEFFRRDASGNVISHLTL